MAMSAGHDNDFNHHDTSDDAFDRAMRQHHREALARVGPRMQARLRHAREVAARQTRATPARPRTGIGWGLAGATAAVFALAIGMQWFGPMSSDTVPPPDDTIVAADAMLASDVDDVLATLDENPDFYLWLAANDDALPPTMEP
jgi:hypothetical protein